jgi:hypothetical protein
MDASTGRRGLGFDQLSQPYRKSRWVVPLDVQNPSDSR